MRSIGTEAADSAKLASYCEERIAQVDAGPENPVASQLPDDLMIGDCVHEPPCEDDLAQREPTEHVRVLSATGLECASSFSSRPTPARSGAVGPGLPVSSKAGALSRRWAGLSVFLSGPPHGPEVAGTRACWTGPAGHVGLLFHLLSRWAASPAGSAHSEPGIRIDQEDSERPTAV
jgi:hypothetical protein